LGFYWLRSLPAAGVFDQGTRANDGEHERTTANGNERNPIFVICYLSFVISFEPEARMMSAASINGVTIGYDDAGTGENVLVLVHGHPFDRSMWRMQVGRISRQDAKITESYRRARTVRTARLAGDCTRSQLVWMEGVGHMPNLEREVEFNEAMERLLEAVQFPQYPLRLN